MAMCDFCGNGITKGTGMIFVQNDGKILNFCSRKCEKNMIKLKRKPRTTTWTREYQKAKKSGKVLKNDAADISTAKA